MKDKAAIAAQKAGCIDTKGKIGCIRSVVRNKSLGISQVIKTFHGITSIERKQNADKYKKNENTGFYSVIRLVALKRV